MKRLVVAVVVTLFLGGVAVAQQTSSVLGGKVRTGDTVTVASAETVDGDLYVFAGDVRIDGTVTGDVVAFAGQIRIDGTVGGDVLASAGTVDVTGAVAGDLRVGAGQVEVTGPVGEDVLAAAGQVTVRGDVGGDLIFGAGQVTVTGDVDGDVFGRAGAYTNTGTVGGSEAVHINRPEPRRTRRPLARALGRFVSAFLLGLALLAYRRRRWLDETVGRLRDELGPSAGWGLLFLLGLVLVPVGAVVVGILLALFFGWLGLGPLVAVTVLSVVAVWALVVFVAFLVITLLAPITVGTWLAGLVLSDSTPLYLVTALGLAALVAVGLVPVLGPLVGLGVTILGGGAWLRTAWPRPARPAEHPVS